MTETLFETIYNLLDRETEGNYEAQSVPSIDKLYQSKNQFVNLCSWQKENTELLNEFQSYFKEINEVSVIPETMKALCVFISKFPDQQI
ncbi:hypothetical protein [Pseudoalteromonas sp. B62]|uniref:hypothetical protein n=1 Tax=Pseudoalteromonas sp. B62 TaxID=630483 RepID=UPI00301E52C3